MEFVKFLVFTLFSSVEYAAILIFTFSLFKIQFGWFKYHMAFVCVSLSYVSFTMREDQLGFVSPFVQLALLILFMWLLFQIHLGYAAFITTVGYISYGLMQAIIILPAKIIFNELEPFTSKMYFVALITSSVFFLISYIVRRKNWGYSFVPFSDRLEMSIKRGNLLFLLVILFLLIGVGIAYYFTVTIKTTLSFLIAFIALLLIEVVILITFSNKKEREEVEGDD